MADAASGANVGLSWVPETTPGVTPVTPTMKASRFLGRNINLTKNILRSAERRQSRMRRDVRHGFRQVGGTLPFELGLEDFDDFIQAALAGQWAAVSTGSTTIAAEADGYRLSAGSFVTFGFLPGDDIVPLGFTNAVNNTRTRITSIPTPDKIVVDNAGLVVEAAAAARSLSLKGASCKVGQTIRTFTMERRFTDIGQYEQFRGVTPNGITVNINPEAIVGGTLDVIGMTGTGKSSTTLGAPVDAGSNAPFDSFTGELLEAGVPIGLAAGLSFTLANNRALGPVLMSRTSPQVYEGQSELTGTLTIHFEDASICNKFDTETETSIDLRLDDIDGLDYHRIYIPRIKYTGWAYDPPASGPVTIPMTFEALEDDVLNTTIVWQRSNDVA